MATKWIFKSLQGDEPWKVLVRHNLARSTPKKGMTWKGLPLCDIVAGCFDVRLTGSLVFKSIWKALEIVRMHISNNDIYGLDGVICGERSIWWNLRYNDKALALVQGCSARLWATKGINTLTDILNDGQLLRWSNLSTSFNLLTSHCRTYSFLFSACSSLSLPKLCLSNAFRFLSYKWTDYSYLPNIKAKSIYLSLTNDGSILAHAKSCWGLGLDNESWQKVFINLWSKPNEPKKKAFLWLLMLHKLPMRKPDGDIVICFYCRTLESIFHIFFDCMFTKEVWNLFGISVGTNVKISEIVTGSFLYLSRITNLFWSIFSIEMLWLIWTFRNDNLFNGRVRSLTESLRRLIVYKIDLQVTVIMRLARRKFDKLLQDGHANVFVWEISHGFLWTRTTNERSAFEEGLANFVRELQIHNRRLPTPEILVIVPSVHPYVDPILWGRELKWSEGHLGWTTWIETVGDDRDPDGVFIS